MIMGDRLRALREEKNLSQGDIEKRTGLVRPYISRVENGHTVPAIETIEKFARALEVPMYQLFYDSDEPPKLPNILKHKPLDETLWGSTGKDARYLNKLRRLLSKTNEENRKLVLHMAQQMARRDRSSKASMVTRKLIRKPTILDRTRKTVTFQTAIQAALRSLLPSPSLFPRPYVVPIGIYLDTSDEQVVKEAKNFWISALADEGFEIIAERELRGSRFIALFGKLPRSTYRDFKKRVSRLAKKANEFGEKFEKATKVVVLGSSIFLIGASPQPSNVPPPPTPIVLPTPQSHDMWKQIAKDIQEEGKTAGEIAGGITAAIGLFKPKKKKKSEDEKD